MTEIRYNGQSISSGLGPTPFISQTEQMIEYGGTRHAILSSFSINGIISGIPNDFSGILAKQQDFLNRFNKNFQTLEVWENGSIISSKPNTVVRDIVFADNKYASLLNYRITLDSYPQELFSGYFGILNPVDEINFVENQNNTITISHRISAHGFNTNSDTSNGLENAIAFVNSKTGWNNQILPQFISTCSGLYPTLKTIEENVDRLHGIYSVVETYIADPRSSLQGILRYRNDIAQDLAAGITRVTLNGSVEGGKFQDFAELRNRYNNFDIYSAANHAYYLVNNAVDLNPNYLASGIIEDEIGKKLNFNIAFDNNPLPNVYFDYKINVDTDNINDLSNITFDGVIRGRGDLYNRFQKVNEFYQNLNLFNYAVDAYNAYGFPYPLNPLPTSSSVIINEFGGEISVSIQYNNKPIPPNGLTKLEYSMNWSPALHKFRSQPLLLPTNGNHGYEVIDLGYATRAEFSINGQAQAPIGMSDSNALSILKTVLNGLGNQYTVNNKKILSTHNFSHELRTKLTNYGFQVGWSYEDSEIVI